MYYIYVLVIYICIYLFISSFVYLCVCLLSAFSSSFRGPMCRSPWETSEKKEVLNLAAYSSEHREVNLAALYPETHRWIRRP